MTGWDGKLDLQPPSRCGSTYNCLSRSVPEIHWHVAGTLSKQASNQGAREGTHVLPVWAGVGLHSCFDVVDLRPTSQIVGRFFEKISLSPASEEREKKVW